MTLNDLKRLLKLLGPEGTVAGLCASSVEYKVLVDLISKANISLPSGASREEVINRLILGFSKKKMKPTDELLQMPYDDLISYFNDTSPSSEDLLEIMKSLNYKVRAEDKRHLRRFVARQISETALFSSVASRGRTDKGE